MIIAAVVNSSQESNILIQPIYMAMLFLSGVTIPITFMPHWLQNITQFIPATYLVTGIGGIVQRGESLAANWQAAVALIITTVVATFIATKLFRWEKEEKLARLREALGAGGAAAVFLPRRVSGVEPARPREGATARARPAPRA